MTGPTRQAIQDALRKVVLADDPLAALEEQQSLLTLGYVVALATANERGVPTIEQLSSILLLELGSAADALEDVPEREPPNLALAANAAFGLRSGTQGLPFRGTRRGRGRVADIAAALGKSVDTVTRTDTEGKMPVLDQLLHGVAREIHMRETKFIAEGLQLEQRARRRPEDSALQVNWLQRFEDYYRIWSPIRGLEWDTALALTTIRDQKPNEFMERCQTTLFYFAEFLTEIKRFQVRRGGLWLTPNADQETPIADLIWKIGAYPPLTEYECSLLRRALTDSAEFIDFADQCQADQRFDYILGRWAEWLLACECSDNHPEDDCGVHMTIQACETFCDLIDEEWDQLADWYPRERPLSMTGPRMGLFEALPATNRATDS